MRKITHLAAISLLVSLSGVASAGDVSGRANVDLGQGNMEITFGQGETRSQPSHEPAPQNRGSAAQVPPGHMPPPGECRIWFHDREPGQQPPPGNCRKLRKQVPPGASLIRG